MKEGYAVLLRGEGVYSLWLGSSEEMVGLEIEKGSTAVLSEDCQPDDCGREINVLRFQKKLPSPITRFCFGILHGNFRVQTLNPHTVRFECGDDSYRLLVSRGVRESFEGLSEEGELACFCSRISRHRRLIAFNTSILDLNRARLLESAQPLSRERAL